MKKIIAIIVVLTLLVVGMTACSKTDEIIVTNEPATVETYEVPVPTEITEIETAN